MTIGRTGEAAVERPVTDADFAAWVEPHLPAMARLAVRLTSPQDAADAVQDALARAWQVRHRFDPARGSPSGFLLAILADQVRQRRRRSVPLLGRSDDITDDYDRPSTGPAEADLDLRRAVDALPGRQRLAVRCVYYADLSIADTAEVMRCSPGTVKSTLADARARLRQAMEEHDD